MVFLSSKSTGCDCNFAFLFTALLNASASLVVKSRPTLRSIILFLLPNVAKLHLKVRSPSFTTTSAPSASKIPLPVEYLKGSYPRMEITATSLSGAIPFPTVYIIPVFPFFARRSMLGVSAASSGVLFPSSSIGKSPIPSMTT